MSVRSRNVLHVTRLASLCALAVALAWPGAGHGAPRERIVLSISGVEDEVAENVRAYLTLTRYATRQDLTDPQVRRLADRAVDEAADALRPFGYYAPKIRSRTTRDEPNWIVRLRIDPGEPVRMKTVEVVVEGPGAKDRELAAVTATSTLKRGTRLDHTAYESLKASLMRAARDRGYLDATLTRRELVVNPTELTADARLTLETGGRYEFGPLTIEQDVIEDDLLRGFLRFSEGQPYSPTEVTNTQYALEDSNYFSSVVVAPGERDPGKLIVPVRIHAEPIKRNRYGVNLGYGTDTGVRGQFTWDNRRVNRRGHRMRAELTASELGYEAAGRYVIPVGDPSLEKLEFSVAYIDEEIGDLDSERVELTGGVTQVFGRWQQVLFLRLSREITGFADGTEDDALLLVPGISYASLPPNFLTGWVRDAAYYAELSGSPQTLGSDASYLRFYGRAERVWKISGPWYLRTRAEFGTSWIDEFSELPASQRFFAGGDRSVRGFGINELSPPVDPADGESTTKSGGGEHKIVGSLELERDLPRNFRGAVFFDFGNAFNDWDTPLEYSVGIGVRWKLPMLMIGLDVAQALSQDDMSPRLHLNITQVL
ncbi:MAG TPA: autotransporter assembly complex family protein [Steroidobacteraceae bacterium]|nr:autotransporter assembly complex family protein [Steroidobacteraceae bacterium]